MNTLILGAGATGGYFGARLMEAGLNVTFLVREHRAQQLKQDGLQLISGKGNFTAPVNAVLDAGEAKDVQLIILSCKAYDLTTAIEAITPAVTRQTMILPLLNGISHLEMLDKAFGTEKVLGGYCHLGVAVTEEGAIKHLNDLDQLTLGPRHDGQRNIAVSIAEHLGKANLSVKNSSRIVEEMWEKYIFVTVLAAATCLFHGSVGAINSTIYGKKLIVQLFEDCIQAAEKANIRLSQDWCKTAFLALTAQDSSSTASMLRDLLKGGQTEHEHIIGNMVKFLESQRMVNPILTAAYTRLQVYASTHQ